MGRLVANEPRVSVIMPAFNVAEYISEAIDSVLSQTLNNYEIIVINDGSPDTAELEEALGPYVDHIVYARKENGGVASARNVGLRLARAPIIAQLDPDDAWLPDFLNTHLEIMDRYPYPDVVYGNSLIFGGTRDDGKDVMALTPSSGEVTFDRLISGECTVLTSLTGKKEAFVRAGYFDESLRTSEDFDMWLRIIKSGGRIAYHRGVVAKYRRRSSSLSADEAVMSRSILQVLSKVERTIPLTSDETESLTRSKLMFEALLSLCEGKKALFNKSIELAVDEFTKANSYYQRPKISMLVWLLKLAPGTTRRILTVRERLICRYVDQPLR